MTLYGSLKNTPAWPGQVLTRPVVKSVCTLLPSPFADLIGRSPAWSFEPESEEEHARVTCSWAEPEVAGVAECELGGG